MKWILTEDRREMGSLVAAAAARCLVEAIDRYGAANLVVATGASQFEVLAGLVQERHVDWQRVHGFHLDEYLDLSPEHPASFCRYLRERFVSQVPLASFHYLRGDRPAAITLAEANAALQGQRIDVALVGIGENGHLAFNDPPADFQVDTPYLIVPLDQKCRQQQVGEGWFETLEDVPKQAISMSIQQILRAKTIFCSVPDRQKAPAVRDTLEQAISPSVPASILRTHANAWLLLDTASAHLLSPAIIATQTMREAFDVSQL